MRDDVQMRAHAFAALTVAAAVVALGCGDDSAAATTGNGGSTGSSKSSADGGGGNGDGGDAASSANGGSGPSTPASSSSQGSGGVGGGSSIDPLAPAPLAAGVRIERLVALQTTSVPVMENDAIANPPEPIVAGRDLWIRGFLSASDASPVRLEIVVTNGGAASLFTSTAAAPAVGLDDDPSTTPFVQISAEWVTPTATFSARVVRDGAQIVAPGETRDERFPRDGSLVALPARAMPPLELTLLPFSWDDDGSGRLPDTSPAALDTLRALFVARFPVADVQITVHAAIPYDRGFDFDGDVDFNDINDLLYDLRESEAPPASAYWFGMVKPAESFDDYCFGTCTTGQSYVADYPEDYDLRVGAGVAFNPEDGGETAVHEVGHMFGRYHAPCYVNSWDDDYPYEDGAVGVMGWDPRVPVALDPWGTTDFMGYCDPQGTSDYTFTALAQRSVAVAALSGSAFATGSRKSTASRVSCTLGR